MTMDLTDNFIGMDLTSAVNFQTSFFTKAFEGAGRILIVARMN
jgi:hypothetical protein